MSWKHIKAVLAATAIMSLIFAGSALRAGEISQPADQFIIPWAPGGAEHGMPRLYNPTLKRPSMVRFRS